MSTDNTTAASDTAAGATPTDAANQGRPLFFNKPFPLDKTRHANKSLAGKPNFSFARSSNSVPIVGPEFALAAKDYPIIFSPADPAMAIAVLGMRPDRNEFVDEEGNWAEWCYIPAYIRRYPFVFFEDRENDKLILCIDEESDLIIDGGEFPLFVDGEPSQSVQSALELCTHLHQNHEATMALGQALSDHDLLMSKSGEAELSSGENLQVPGFRLVDEEKFKALPDKVILEFREKGWLGMIYMHLASSVNWSLLAERTARAQAAEG